MNAPAAMLKVDGLTRHYRLPRTSLWRPRETVYALNGVSFAVERGRSFGIVGESGCGKSTLARLVMALETPTEGRIELLGQPLGALPAAALQNLRRHFQMVFQDPYGSLNPRHTVARIVAEPLTTLEAELPAPERQSRMLEALQTVGLRPGDSGKYPHEFSGGQRQRIAIARALITRPELIVADEPVSALDVSVQAQILNLLRDLQERHNVTYMLISHDLGVVDYVCDEVAVMYLGRIVEQAPTATLFSRAAHPYTQALLDAVPRVGAGRRRQRVRLQGGVMTQTRLPTGCAFADRCPRAEARCHREAPPLRPLTSEHHAACHFA